MTSDTKIGLLLGLVFIFVIAFLINGLPSFRTRTHGNEYTARMVGFGSQGLDLAGQERQVQSRLSPEPRLQETVQRAPIFRGLPSYTAPESANPVRGQWDPPSSSPLERDIQQEAIQAVSQVQSATATAVSSSPELGIGVHRRPVVHTVEENENLTLIAKRYYGDAEGNRKINCDRIFEANRDQLASPDKVCVGQRLIIPPLRGNLTLADVCVPVSPVPPRDTASPTPATSARPRFYEVKEGDCLSKIAAAVLGNGRRYQELIQLNQDLLPDEDSLTVGTRLRLPTN